MVKKLKETFVSFFFSCKLIESKKTLQLYFITTTKQIKSKYSMFISELLGLLLMGEEKYSTLDVERSKFDVVGA